MMTIKTGTYHSFSGLDDSFSGLSGSFSGLSDSFSGLNDSFPFWKETKYGINQLLTLNIT
jgi:hypothetical protein